MGKSENADFSGDRAHEPWTGTPEDVAYDREDDLNVTDQKPAEAPDPGITTREEGEK